MGRVPHFKGYTFIGIGQPANGEYYLGASGSLNKCVDPPDFTYASSTGICYSRNKPARSMVDWVLLDELKSDTLTITPGQILIAQEKNSQLFFNFCNWDEKIEVELTGTTYSRYSLMEPS